MCRRLQWAHPIPLLPTQFLTTSATWIPIPIFYLQIVFGEVDRSQRRSDDEIKELGTSKACQLEIDFFPSSAPLRETTKAGIAVKG